MAASDAVFQQPAKSAKNTKNKENLNYKGREESKRLHQHEVHTVHKVREEYKNGVPRGFEVNEDYKRSNSPRRMQDRAESGHSRFAHSSGAQGPVPKGPATISKKETMAWGVSGPERQVPDLQRRNRRMAEGPLLMGLFRRSACDQRSTIPDIRRGPGWLPA